jgi:hypothetical protein
MLNTDAVSGAGTLAGNAAASVSQENKEGVGTGIKESFNDQLTAAWFLFHRGEEQVKRGEIARFHLRTEQPEDSGKKAKTYIDINTALASVGRAIDPEQIETEFAVRTVELQKVQPPAATSAAGDDKTAAARARRAASAKAPKLASPDDVSAAGSVLVRKAAEDFGERILEIFEAADTIEDGIDALWQGYSGMEVTRIASAVRDVTVTAHLMGRGDVGE